MLFILTFQFVKYHTVAQHICRGQCNASCCYRQSIIVAMHSPNSFELPFDNLLLSEYQL